MSGSGGRHYDRDYRDRDRDRGDRDRDHTSRRRFQRENEDDGHRRRSRSRSRSRDRDRRRHGNGSDEYQRRSRGSEEITNRESYEERNFEHSTNTPPPSGIRLTLGGGGQNNANVDGTATPPGRGGPPTSKLKMTLQPVAPPAPPARLKVAAIFGDDSDDEVEEMPPEARMRMKNVGRDTPTSAGPNSFGKTKIGFCNVVHITEKEVEAGAAAKGPSTSSRRNK